MKARNSNYPTRLYVPAGFGNLVAAEFFCTESHLLAVFLVMKDSNKLVLPVQMRRQWMIVLSLIITAVAYGQKSIQRLERMPVDLETELALSSMPSHLRDKATVYLLDPSKGYYVAREGTNGVGATLGWFSRKWQTYNQVL